MLYFFEPQNIVTLCQQAINDAILVFSVDDTFMGVSPLVSDPVVVLQMYPPLVDY